ncbi:hypothetical protein [Tengunoibacter tsumagoiensis]|uniref:DUF1345 domain-containing protein n=1 Tax=Tengunoibacter tsumagoiensis TaxID=2014871 RepID=A0A401ZYK4_9CHLR|nr:hypothetical protein [Tengunoibacter tsumagoiensis]GCE11925.1 hypothetical protein KTT_17840 [Tengunoibacter tsumagoiensis]
MNQTQQPSDADVSHMQQKKLPFTARLIAIGGTLLIGVVFLFLPARLTLGPNWLPLAFEIVLVLPVILSHLFQRPLSAKVNRSLSFILLGGVTLALVIGVTLLISTLPHRSEAQAISLLRTGALLWIANILVFALWYWEIDGGGPIARHHAGHRAADFLFPQQASGNSVENWAPNFVDYVFLAFTGATALSPADTFPLTRPAKVLMMIEALLAMTILAVLIGRAVNIL